MSTDRRIDKICITAVAVTLIITILFMYGGSFGIAAVTRTMKYESTLFDTSYVHKIDIVMNDWGSFIESCENEEYSPCTVVIDGNRHRNIAIRAKGNTSLSSVKAMGSERYSFKLEFDHYEDGKTLDGLDKLCLNNLIQDNTMMKDYLSYRMMSDFGVDSPLCSFAWLTVNGEDWGLYLAVEGIEDSFLERNYGSDAGELYKPDSMSFGGGRGNGKNFNMDDFDFSEIESDNFKPDSFNRENGSDQGPGGGFRPEGQGGMPDFSDFSFDDIPDMPGMNAFGGENTPDFGDFSFDNIPDMGGFGGMGSDDVKLKYIDDDPDSYPNIFDNAKTDVSSSDKKRLISSLKKLSTYSDLENVLDMDEVLRYFVVHIFLCNGDSYTGSMIHNYYLHEADGRLGMIPWDYNLAFGTFQGGNATSSVNADIDNPVSMGNTDDRPMLGWIFSDEKYTEEYHRLFKEFIEKWFTDGELERLISDTAEMIRPYVEKDPTKFCTSEEFETGVKAISQFAVLRGKAVLRQLSGDDTAVEADMLNLSDMGSMGGGFKGGNMPGKFSGGSDEARDQGSNPDRIMQFGPDNSQFFGLPDGRPDKTPDNEAFTQMPEKRPDNQSTEYPSKALIWLGISVLVLAGGLVIAVKKKY